MVGATGIEPVTPAVSRSTPKNDNPLKENKTMSDEKVNARTVPKCAPAADAEWWSHHWIGPKDGDQEPWLWGWGDEGGEWHRGGEKWTPEGMAARGWVYGGPCERPEVVADLRRRLASAEAGRGVVVPFTPTGATP